MTDSLKSISQMTNVMENPPVTVSSSAKASDDDTHESNLSKSIKTSTDAHQLDTTETAEVDPSNELSPSKPQLPAEVSHISDDPSGQEIECASESHQIRNSDPSQESTMGHRDDEEIDPLHPLDDRRLRSHSKEFLSLAHPDTLSQNKGAPCGIERTEISHKDLIENDKLPEMIVFKKVNANDKRIDDESGDSDELEDYNDSNARIVNRRRMSKNDANSIVGGHSILDDNGSIKTHPIADSHKSTEEQVSTFAGFANDESLQPSSYDSSQKVFSFSLPFGGLPNLNSLTSTLSKHFPLIGNNNELNELRIQTDLKLERQVSIDTLEDANYFSKVNKTDNVRMRAVKSSLSLIPDFIKNKDKGFESIYNELSGNVLIMGGFRGSILRETKTHKRVWVPFKAGIHLRKVNLLLGPNESDEINASKLIYPDGVLSHIGPIDICRKFMRKLRANPKLKVHDWGYDWRLSGEFISCQLVDYLQDVYNKTGEPTIVIAHSMGGLMAHGALQKAPHLFRGIVYVGSPSECLNILGPIRFGDSVILSDKILTYETNFMMRSCFNFLPLSGRVFANLEQNEFYDLDYFDPETWVEYNLNPLVSKKRQLFERAKMNPSRPSSPNSLSRHDSHNSFSSITSAIKNGWRKTPLSPTRTFFSSATEQRKKTNNDSASTLVDDSCEIEDEEYSFTFTEAYEYLKRSLAAAKKFILGLEWRDDLKHQYPPLAIVYGNKVPSVRGSIVRSAQDIKDGNYYEFYYGHGDGVVHQRWLMPERKGFTYYNKETGEGEIVGKFPLDCGHVNLMSDFKAMGQALHAIHVAEKGWKHSKNKLKEQATKTC